MLIENWRFQEEGRSDVMYKALMQRFVRDGKDAMFYAVPEQIRFVIEVEIPFEKVQQLESISG